MRLSELLSTRGEIGSADALKQRVNSDPDFKDSLEDIYLNMFGKKLNKECPDCWCDAYFEILSKTKDNRQYRLRAGAIIIDAESGTIYNQHNISDEYASRHIKKHPESIDLFVEIPTLSGVL